MFARPNQLYVAIALVVLNFLVFKIIILFKRKSSNTIVLTGPSGSGKTALFYQLRDGKSHRTITSMEPNEDTFVLHSEKSKLQKDKPKPVHVVDVPGHPRLRSKLDDYLPRAAGVVFVVDSVEIQHNHHLAAEYLYGILTDASVVKKKIPVIVLCNKADRGGARNNEFIRKQLEKEIDKLRTSRTAVPESDVMHEITLGTPGKPFDFSQCLNLVTVGEASGSSITQLEDFIRGAVNPRVSMHSLFTFIFT